MTVAVLCSLQTLSRALDIAFPRLLKFLVCVGILFSAFMLCGWVTLAPFHYKVGFIEVRVCYVWCVWCGVVCVVWCV